MNVDVNYEIKSQTDTTVSFVVTMTQDMFDAYNAQTYYNLDIAANQDITLADVLGEDWNRYTYSRRPELYRSGYHRPVLQRG